MPRAPDFLSLPSFGLAPRVAARLVPALVFALALVVFVVMAFLASLLIEQRSAASVSARLLNEGYTWARVEVDGLQVILSGTAPNEAARFRAVNLAGAEVESARLRDQFEVTPTASATAPLFSIEMLRNDDGIQLIGLLPEGGDAEALTAAAAELVAPEALSEMLEAAAYPAPEGWAPAFAFGLEALRTLPRAKISVSAGRAAVTALARSEAERQELEATLAALRPQGISVTIDISAPRPVLTPFTLRFVKDAEGARFDACSADSERAKAEILAAAAAAGAEAAPETCVVGIGVPSPSWSRAVSAGIRAVAELGDATITFSDADVTLEAGQAVGQDAYDRVLGQLRAELPEVFSLAANLAQARSERPAGPVEFTAALAPLTGQVELRGRLTDERTQQATESVAKALFGAGRVHLATRLDPDLPEGWPNRVIAGLEALAELEHGSLLVRPDTVEVTGVTGSQLAKARVAQILSERLGKGQTFRVAVNYDKALDPIASLPTSRECDERVQAVLAANKITFPPASAEIDAAAARVIAQIAAGLQKCGPMRYEIAGHTDAQGSDGGNLSLSQARADAVLLALEGRQVDVSAMRAKGYGETAPIADNGEEAGREANRRIEFIFAGAAPEAGNSPNEEVARAAAAAAAAAGQGKALATPPDAPSLAPTDKTPAPRARPAKQEG